jgi:hypothetical protein
MHSHILQCIWLWWIWKLWWIILFIYLFIYLLLLLLLLTLYFDSLHYLPWMKFLSYILQNPLILLTFVIIKSEDIVNAIDWFDYIYFFIFLIVCFKFHMFKHVPIAQVNYLSSLKNVPYFCNRVNVHHLLLPYLGDIFYELLNFPFSGWYIKINIPIQH